MIQLICAIGVIIGVGALVWVTAYTLPALLILNMSEARGQRWRVGVYDSPALKHRVLVIGIPFGEKTYGRQDNPNEFDGRRALRGPQGR